MITDHSPNGYRPIGDEENKKFLLEMMQYVHDFCEEHDIRYFLYFGSLLGAVRHHGFIPWDDDMDICMTRAEYEKFVRLFPHNDSSRYKVMTPNDSGHYVPYGKIIDTNTLLVELDDKPIGLYIDLFVIDNEGYTLRGAKLFLRFVSFFLYILSCVRDLPLGRTRFRRLIYVVAHFFLRVIPESFSLQIIDAVSKIKRRRELMPYVGSVNASTYNERQILRGEWFDDAVLLKFENHHFYAPANYHEVLKTIYVNYMDLPSEKDRIGHHDSTKRWIKI